MVNSSFGTRPTQSAFTKLIRQHVFLGFGVTLLIMEGTIIAGLARIGGASSVQIEVVTWLLAFPLSVVTLGYCVTLLFLIRDARAIRSVDTVLKDKNLQQLEYHSKMFHVMQTPLATIQGYAELLGEPPLRQDDAFLDKCRHVMVKEVRQISQVIDHASTLSNLEACGYEMMLTRLRLLPLVEDVIKDSSKGTGRDIMIENRAGDVMVAADMVWLKIALANLVSNALRFSSDPLPVEVTLALGYDREQVEIQVKDYGPGLTEYEKSLLFRPFVRVVNEKTRDKTGSGLGLYIAQQIVQRHHGDIRVDSQPGSGSTFKVSLPVAQQIEVRRRAS